MFDLEKNPSLHPRKTKKNPLPHFPLFSSSSNSWSQNIHVFLLCFPSRLSSSSLLYFSRQIQSWRAPSLRESQWRLCLPMVLIPLFLSFPVPAFRDWCVCVSVLGFGLLLSGSGEFWERFGEPNRHLTTVAMSQCLDLHVQWCHVQSVLALPGVGRDQQIWSLS